MSSTYQPQDTFMRLAISKAIEAKEQGDYAIGAVVVRGNEVLGQSGNRIKTDADPTQHAEIAAIRLACVREGSRHLPGAILYTTAEPCPMCAAAAVWARMDGIVSGSTIDDMAEFRAQSNNHEWTWRTFDLAAQAILEQGDPQVFFIEGFLREECRKLFHET